MSDNIPAGASGTYTVTISNTNPTGDTYTWGNVTTDSGSTVPGILGGTSTKPLNGQRMIIGGYTYQYNEATNTWEVVSSPQQGVAPPKIQIQLDARDMIDVLRQYRSFLEDLEDMDATLAQIVDDTIFGLNEAIEALEKLGY